MSLIEIIATVLLSPLGHFCVKGKVDSEFIINLVLYVIGVVVIGSIHAFYTYGINMATAVLCWLLPPVGIIFAEKGTWTEVLICCLLCLLGWFPGVIYAFHSVLNGESQDKLIDH